MTTEKVYILGGTGNVGSIAVKELLKNGVQVTLYARTPDKARRLFMDDANLTVVQGDWNNLEPFEASIAGHTRLFLLVGLTEASLKVTIAEKAYAAGVKQIVDISSGAVNTHWRYTYVGAPHQVSEYGVFSIPNRGAYVALRPWRFMSNNVKGGADGIVNADQINDTTAPDTAVAWISPDDIGLLAANILRDPIEKHADSVYEMVGDILTHRQRADVLTQALGHSISYVQITPEERYSRYISFGLPHFLAYSVVQFAHNTQCPSEPTPALSVLLGRPPQTLKAWLDQNKHALI